MEIITSDLRTGLEVGRTEWSGPGTLTLSTLTAAAANNIYKRSSTASPSSHPYHSHLRPADVEVFSVPPQFQGSSQSYRAPPQVIVYYHY